VSSENSSEAEKENPNEPDDEDGDIVD